MNSKVLKKAGIIALGVVGLLAGCGNTDTADSNGGNGEETYKIGIVQIAEHPSLDDARNGFTDQLESEGVTADIEYQNAQGETATAQSIIGNFIDSGVDMIYAIGTPVAQTAKQMTTDTEIPVLFSAVTDPVGSEIVDSLETPGGNITGTTDATPVKDQLALLPEIDDSIKKVGIVYNTSEANSEVQVKDAEKAADELGLTIEAIGVNNVNDMSQAIDTALAKSDALYNITDNLVASSLGVISDKALAAKKIVLQAYIDETDKANGILICNGFSYTDLGKQTGSMAKEILVDGKDAGSISVGRVTETTNVVRQNVLDTLGLDASKEPFKDAQLID